MSHRFVAGRWTRVSGFTLLEMLVVMTLLSIIMLAMVSAMRGAGQSSDRVDARLAVQDEERVAERFLLSALGRISARAIAGGAALESVPQGAALKGGTGAPVLFSGAPDQISWVGVLPARYGAGGRSFMHLAVEPVEGAAALVFRYVPWQDQPGFPDWSGATAQVLLSDVTGLSIQYENDQPENMDASTSWESPWSHPDYLPVRVILDVQRSTLGPMQWVVPLWPLPSSRPGGLKADETVIGGST
ncbi:type II secretion system protein [Diaphorobacter sp.]|uniref:type II secretion system protein n=1 Tax=Diaphorobacter sp. TaxID=1934310 RepID=UPI0028AE9B79|nr:type II secretion system protein [Diaphorobacter sp.]